MQRYSSTPKLSSSMLFVPSILDLLLVGRYSTVGFNSPMLRYAAVKDQDNGRAAVRELKELVKQAHLNGVPLPLYILREPATRPADSFVVALSR